DGPETDMLVDLDVEAAARRHGKCRLGGADARRDRLTGVHGDSSAGRRRRHRDTLNLRAGGCVYAAPEDLEVRLQTRKPHRHPRPEQEVEKRAVELCGADIAAMHSS